MRRIKVFATVLGLFFVTAVWAQQTGGTTGGTTGGGSRGGTNPTSPGTQQPGRPTDPWGQQPQQERFPQQQMQRPLILSGKVMLEDSTPPPGPVRIYLDCDGQRKPAGYTSTKGTFSVDLNDRHNAAFADASVGGSPDALGQRQGGFGSMGTNMSARSDGLGRVNLFGCQLIAELGGYQVEPIQLGTRRVFDNPDVGTMILHRLDGVEGTSISVTSLTAPKKAKKAYNKAFKEMHQGQPNLAKASKELETAVSLHPEYASAWDLLGRIRLREDNPEQALAAFEKAVEADPKFLDPYPALASLALTQERWDDGLQLSTQLLRLNPHAAMAHYYSAIANFRLGHMEVSKKSVLELKEKGADRKFPQSHQILGMIHAQQGLYEQAAVSFRDYLTIQPDGSVAQHIQRQIYEWESLGVIQKQETAAVSPVAPAAIVAPQK